MVELVVINATVLNGRQRYLASAKLPGLTPFEYSLELAARIFPEARLIVLTNHGDIPEAIPENATLVQNCPMNCNGPAWMDTARRLDLKSNATIAVFSPFVGVLSEKRVRKVVEHFQSNRAKISFSGGQIDHNSHPSFNQTIPHRYANVSFCPMKEGDTRVFDPQEFVVLGLEDYFPHQSKVPGSQWLPSLYRADGAVILCRAELFEDIGRADISGDCLCVVEDDGKSEVMAYRLPVFIFNEKARLTGSERQLLAVNDESL
ncbi:hypothetical protein [Salidesulfovibrio onnuriiensis]|uniref:hypothetical protein n=1 Tax=Salidesulfovibrio onnuriiensis TaxID=2583823 RepID=UPI0011C8FC3F|nr:hypothetical protein [Salidesulfovibrio onnuriiensis]